MIQSSLGHLVWAGLPLAVVAILARRWAPRLAADAPFDARWDLGLAAACGLLFALVTTFGTGEAFLSGAPITGADFHDYCSCIGASRGDHSVGWRASRSFAAGLLPAILARELGVVDGLVLGAILSQWLMGAGIMLWARALHSRLAGVAAVGLAWTVAPLATLGRTASFYPEVIAVSVLSAALSLLAVRTGSLRVMLAAGTTVGLVLLMDVRGLVWAPPMIATLMLAVARLGAWPRRLGALVLIITPLVISAQLSEAAHLSGVPSLERQMSAHVDDVLTILGEPPAELASTRPDRGSVWGQTPVWEIPGSLVRLVGIRARVPPGAADLPETVQGRTQQITPWLPITGAALCACVWGVRRRWWVLLGSVLTAAPFVAALQSAGWFLYRPRFLASGMAVVPVVVGTGLAVCILGALRAGDLRTALRPGAVLPLVGGCVVLLSIGRVPTWFAPDAGWRFAIPADANPRDAIQSVARGVSVGPQASAGCAAALQADLDAGHGLGSRLLGWAADDPN